MSLFLFVVLAALSAVAIAYPILKPTASAVPEPRLSDAQVQMAVQRLRESRKRGVSLAEPPSTGVCPTCGTPHKIGDRFCVRCGQSLPQQETAGVPTSEPACPSCGASLREDDVFCARCGHQLPASGADASREEVES